MEQLLGVAAGGKGSGHGVILRTSWVIGPVGKNFARTMVRLHREKSEIGVVADQVGCPTSTATLALACWRVIAAMDTPAGLPAVLHWSDAGAASWYDVCCGGGRAGGGAGVVGADGPGESHHHGRLPHPGPASQLFAAGLHSQPQGSGSAAHPLAPGAAAAAGGGGMSATFGSGQRLAKKLSHLRAVEQAQQSLEFTAVACGGVELEGKSALIKTISESIQPSNALSLFSCSVSLLSCFSRISLTGSRRQLSIDKNERKRDSDEPDAPLLGETESLSWEVDVVIGRKESDQANDTANDGLQQSFAIKPKPPPGRWRIQIPKNLFHPKQPRTTRTNTILVHLYCPVS